MKLKLSLVILVPLLLWLSLPANPAAAQQPVSDDEVNAVAKQLYCPVCENTPLDVCPTQACKDWRELIRQQLSEGKSEQEIIDYFEAQYGPQVLAQPPTRGFPALVWLLPVLGLVGGGIFLWRVLRRWQNPAAHAAVPSDIPPVTPNISPDVLARIEQDVDARF